MDLFGDIPIENMKEGRGDFLPPLADRMRPRSLEEFTGQTHLIGEGRLVKKLLAGKEIPSLILWGPPGTGKTTLAQIIARAVKAHFESFSAVMSGVKEVRRIMEEAKRRQAFQGAQTILFVDEIHRFNKAQQDAFLPHVEDGTLTLIGATTENPSFELIPPLLSRCRVLVLEALNEPELVSILNRALSERERGLGSLAVEVQERVLDFIASISHGDARYALNSLEASVMITRPDEKGVRRITLSTCQEAVQTRAILYDKGGEEHYNVISAFIKSMRGSDPDAALYWLARMLEAGEDPLFIARRMVIFASEDIGNADPQALSLAVAVKDAFHFVGLPEGWIPLAQGVAYLAAAPKSNASYRAYGEALEDVRKKGALPVPLHLRNAPTGLMKDLGYGKGYLYPHDREAGVVAQSYLPDALAGREYYRPKEAGFEKTIQQRQREVKAARQKKKRGKSPLPGDSHPDE